MARDRGAFVGREQEMRELLSALDDAFASRGRLLLLVGEPGIGKTRMIEELAAAARERGSLVLVGRCYEGDGAPPYWPWMQLLRVFGRVSDPAGLLSEIGRNAADLAPVRDALGDGPPGPEPAPSADPEQARFRFFDSMTMVLKRAARRQPLVLILDDLHWGDQPSLLLLQFVAREIADAPLLLVGTYRDVDGSRRQPFVDALGELARTPSVRIVPLAGLSEGDVGRFMEVAGGSTPPAALVELVYERTAGNPFFVGELVPLLAPDGAWSPPGEPATSMIPVGVLEVVAARVGRLSRPCQEVLRIAAVAGRQFDIQLVAAVAAATAPHAPGAEALDPEAFLEPLEEALQKRLIHEVAGVPGVYGFSHALIRESLYAVLTSGQRFRLHRSVGEALAALPPPAVEQRLAELAYHFLQALAGGGDVDKAVTYAWRAADRARAALAYEDAAHHYDAALRVLARQGTAERRQCELLLALGEAQRQAGNEPAAHEAYRRAGDLARRLREPELMAHAALGFAGVVIGVQVDQQVVAVLEEGLAVHQQPDSALRAFLLARLAMELFFAPDAERRTQASAEAVATARRAGDVRALIHALEAVHFVAWGHGGPSERLALADEMIQLAARINSAENLARAYSLRIGDLLELGRIADVDATMAGLARLVEEWRVPSHRWGLEMFRAMRALIDGRFDEAEQLASSALAIGQGVQSETAANFFAAQLFFLRREQGRLAELEDALHALRAAHTTLPVWRAALAMVYAECGRRAEAEREFDAAAAGEFRDLPRDNSWLPAVTGLAEVCAWLGDTRRAAVLYDLLLPHAGLAVVAGIGSACSGAAARPLALLATTLGRWDDAERLFDRALAMNRALGGRPFVARTQYEYAAMLLASSAAASRDPESSRSRALELAAEALDAARILGMSGLVAHAQALMERAGVALPAERERPALQSDDEAQTPVAGASTRAADAVFRAHEGYWTCAFEHQVCRLKDTKGMRYIGWLLHEPNRPFHVTELAGMAERCTPSAAGPGGSSSSTPQAVDAEAAGACREHLRELRSELDEAERFHDTGRVRRLRDQIDDLTGELARLLGLAPIGGEPVPAHELVRLRVTKAIKAAARKISAEHPALGHHIRTTIRTGAFCLYTPDPTKPIRWD